MKPEEFFQRADVEISAWIAILTDFRRRMAQASALLNKENEYDENHI